MIVFSGVGVSAISDVYRLHGTEELRSCNGFRYTPEFMMSEIFFDYHTEEFFSFYRDKICDTECQPNIVHYKIAELERTGKVKAVVTQAVDGLFQKAGCRNVIEVNGTIYNNSCIDCGCKHSTEYILGTKEPPHCRICGGLIKPGITLYGESFDRETIEKVIHEMEKADFILIMGTSLRTYPVPRLLDYVQDNCKIAVINHSDISNKVNKTIDLMIKNNLEEVFSDIDNLV
jgi:NAD-dependent deacetylase